MNKGEIDMKLEEAAQSLGVTRETIQRWISQGQIKVQESRHGRGVYRTWGVIK
jgi:excisionase family DNA binding protein